MPTRQVLINVSSLAKKCYRDSIKVPWGLLAHRRVHCALTGVDRSFVVQFCRNFLLITYFIFYGTQVRFSFAANNCISTPHTREDVLFCNVCKREGHSSYYCRGWWSRALTRSALLCLTSNNYIRSSSFTMGNIRYSRGM